MCFCHGMVLQHVVTPHPSSSWLSSPKMNASPCTRSGKRPRMSAFWNAYFQIGATCVGCACVLFRETINTQLRCAYRKGWNKDIGWRRCNVQRLPRGPATSLGQECCQHDGNRWVPQFHIELMWTKLFSSRSHGLHIFSSIEAWDHQEGPKPKPKPKPKNITPDEKLKKDLQKDIKEQLPKNTVAVADVNVTVSYTSLKIAFLPTSCRLNDKARKARDTAADMNALKIPHQEVGSQVLNSVYSISYYCGLACELQLQAMADVAQQTPWLFPEPRPEASLLSNQWYACLFANPKCRLEDKIFAEWTPQVMSKPSWTRKKVDGSPSCILILLLSQDCFRKTVGP